MAKKASDLDAFSVKRGVCQGEGCGVAMAMPDKSNQDLCPNCLGSKMRDVAADQDKSFFDQTKASRRTAARQPASKEKQDALDTCPDCGTWGNYGKPFGVCVDGPYRDDACGGTLDRMGKCENCDDYDSKEKEHLEMHKWCDDPRSGHYGTDISNGRPQSCSECDNERNAPPEEYDQPDRDSFYDRPPRYDRPRDAYYGRKTATQYETRADKLNPRQHVRTPTGGTTQVRRVRNHESSGQHVYVDTDLGTTVVPRGDVFEVVPQNARQQESPGYGTPGGNSNTLPFDPHGPGGGNTSTSSSCPVCGRRGSFRRSGDHYECLCGYQETFGGTSDKNYSSSTQVIRTFTNKNNNRRTASVIAQRARQVLDLEENQ